MYIIGSQIIHVISKSNEHTVQLRFEITSMISDQNNYCIPLKQGFHYVLKQEGSHGRVSGHPYKSKGRRPEALGGLVGKFAKLDSRKCIFQHSGVEICNSMSSFCKQNLQIIYGAFANTSTK